MNNGYCGNLACEMNEWCGTKGTGINMRRGPRLIGVVMIRGMDLRCDAYEELISRVDMEL